MNCKDIFCQESKLEWTSDLFAIFEMTFSVNLEGKEILNFNSRLNDTYKDIYGSAIVQNETGWRNKNC